MITRSERAEDDRAERAARVMANAIAKREEHFVFTGHGKIGAWIALHFPRLLSWAIKHFG
jgi:hypothetical protein